MALGGLVGGLAGGSKGLLVGGMAASGLAYAVTRDTFVSLPQAINQLPYRRRELIATQIESILNRLDVTDVTTITTMAAALMAEGGIGAIMSHNVLSTVFTEGIDYVRNQVKEEQRSNSGYLV